MVHELKILPEYYCDVANGKKTFELRKHDRDYKVGDTLILREYANGKYTAWYIKREIVYILEGGQYGLEKGYCILGIK